MRSVYRRWAVLSISLASLGLANFVCGGPLSQTSKPPVRSKKPAAFPLVLAKEVVERRSPSLPIDLPLIPSTAPVPLAGRGNNRAVNSRSSAFGTFLIRPANGTIAGQAKTGLQVREQPLTPSTLQINGPIRPTPTGAIIPARGPEAGVNIVATPPSPEYTTYLGSQTPSLAVDWVTPEIIIVGQESVYDLVLRNTGRVPVEQVVIEQALPQGFKLVEAIPQPKNVAGGPVWMIERLNPQQEARISLRLIPLEPGDAQSQARVTFSTFSSANFRVVQPILEIDVEAPESAILGTQAIFSVTVRNTGSGTANNAILQVRLPDALTHVAEGSTYELGVLSPSESRSIQILADVKHLGLHNCEFIASADGGLRDEQTKQVRVLGAQLTLDVDGPDFRYVTRPARYTLRIRNSGTASAQNVRLRTRVPASFAFQRADKGGRFDAAGNTINWFLGQIEPNQEIEVACQLRAMDKGEFPIQAQVIAERSLRAQAQHLTRVEGIAAILLECVDVDDPVEVGTRTFYEILITNQGTEAATNVQLMAEAPEGMVILEGKGPTQSKIEGQTIHFAPLPRLAPRADAIYRVFVKGDRSGDYRMRVEASADTLDEPVIELESTKVYQD